jgi:hypothetical protein
MVFLNPDRSDFDAVLEPGFDPKPSGAQWQEEWQDSLEGYQPELQAICSVVQQSNGLALKAKISAPLSAFGPGRGVRQSR